MPKIVLSFRNIHEITRMARNELAKMIVRDTVPYVPYKEGSLSNSVKIIDDGRTIIYNKPYAKYQWYGKLMLAPSGSAWARKGESKYISGRDLKYNRTVHEKASAKWVEKSAIDNMGKWEKELEKKMNGN